MNRRVAISIRDLSFAYGENIVLDHVDLDVYNDDFLGLVGPNGGGKTTLIKLILGLLRPRSGRIEVFGEKPKDGRAKIGYVPQYARYSTDVPVTVKDFVAMGRLGHVAIGRRFTANDWEVTRQAMEELSIGHLAARSLDALSGGERQRMLVARALACEPQALVLDEPTISVDGHVEQDFYAMLKSLNERIPIILVSHDLGFISAYLTRVACLNRRLVVNDVDDVRAQDIEAMYHTSVKMWSHDCEL